jgi:hypothetical protein
LHHHLAPEARHVRARIEMSVSDISLSQQAEHVKKLCVELSDSQVISELLSRLVALAKIDMSSALLHKLEHKQLNGSAFRKCAETVKQLRAHDAPGVKQHAKIVLKKWKRAYKHDEEANQERANAERVDKDKCRKRRDCKKEKEEKKKRKKTKRKEKKDGTQVAPGDLVWVYDKAGWVCKKVMRARSSLHSWSMEGGVIKRLHPDRWMFIGPSSSLAFS